MGKLRVQVCLISARGLRRTPSFWKLQWYAVGWIHPDDKYCTKIDASGSGNPVWKTRFSAVIDPSESNLQELALHIEVYCREPVFLGKSLFGSATVALKEFVEKYGSESETVEEVGSFQLRKKKSEKPVGFVDLSIRISKNREEIDGSSSLGPDEGFNLRDYTGGNIPASTSGSLQPATLPIPFPPNNPHHHQFGSFQPPPLLPLPANVGYGGYQPPPRPPPVVRPPPVSFGYSPYFGPSSYINMPSSVAPPQGRGMAPGFGMGVAAGGALAAGAMMYGDDLMSGFQVPGASLDASVSLSTYPPF